MKKKYLLSGFLIIALLVIISVASSQAATILFPSGGGTGTGQAPTSGQVLVGQSNGTYLPQATSTLGFTSGGAGGITSLGGVSTSTIALNGTANQVNVATTSNSITLSLPQSIATTSAVTFNGITSNATTTLNANLDTNVNSALLLAGSSGVISGYLGTGPCTSGQAMTTISAVGAQTCAAFLNAVGTAGTDVAVSGSTLNVPDAGASARGVVTSGTQTFGGAKTFNGGITDGGNFIFSTDNTNDIGASGANRARDLFIARNATIGGTLGVTATSTLGALQAGTSTISTSLVVGTTTPATVATTTFKATNSAGTSFVNVDTSTTTAAYVLRDTTGVFMWETTYTSTSTGAFQIFRDTGGTTCSKVTTNAGVLSAATTTCPS